VVIMQKEIEQHYIENYGKFVKILTNRAGSVQGAEDVIQDAYERALRYKNSFNPNLQEFGGWFNGILNNALRCYKLNERCLGMSVEYDEEREEGEPLLEWQQNTIDCVLAEVDKRKFVERQALYLYFFRQYKPRDIVQVLEITNAYVRTLVKKFKKEMKAKYEEKL